LVISRDVRAPVQHPIHFAGVSVLVPKLATFDDGWIDSTTDDSVNRACMIKEGQAGDSSKLAAQTPDLRPELHAAGIIHRQELHGGAANGRDSYDSTILQDEVIGPGATAWMKQPNDFSRHRVDRGQVRPFVQVTPMARQCQVVRVVSAAVLPGDYVFNVMGKLARFLREKAILATSGRPPPHELARGSIHRITCGSGAGSGGPSA
jgi:hypothetical protein